MNNRSEDIRRNTVKNFVEFVRTGQFVEIVKILRRRTINFINFAKRFLFYFWLKLAEYPTILKARQTRTLNKTLKTYFDYTGLYSDKDIKVGLILQHGVTHPKSSAFVRLITPLTTDIAKSKLNIKLYADDTVDVVQDTKVVIIQRTAFSHLAYAQKFVKLLKSKNIKLVLDKDDAFGLIDESHPEYESQQAKLEALNYLINEADAIWVSSNALKNSLGIKKEKTVVIENTLDKRVWDLDNQRINSLVNKNKVKLVYMGTGTHDADLAMIMPALDKLNKDYPDKFELTIIGVASALPERNWLKRKHVSRAKTLYPKFVNWFLKQGPFDYGLSPLVDNNFNKAKSDIKCLDYFAAGIMPIVSDIEPYNTPQLQNFIIKVKGSTDAWFNTLEDIIKNPNDTLYLANKQIKAGQEYIWSKRSSEIAGHKMLSEIEKLLGSGG